MRSPRLSTLPAVQTRIDVAGPRAGKEPREASYVDGASQTAATTSANSPPAPPPPPSSVRRSYSNVSDVVESQAGSVEFSSGPPGVAVASLRSAARKRRDFRNERASLQRVAVDQDDVCHSSTDQPSGDSGDGAVLWSEFCVIVTRPLRTHRLQSLCVRVWGRPVTAVMALLVCMRLPVSVERCHLPVSTMPPRWWSLLPAAVHRPRL